MDVRVARRVAKIVKKRAESRAKKRARLVRSEKTYLASLDRAEIKAKEIDLIQAIEKKTRPPTVREAYAAKRQARQERNRRFVELFLTGYSQAEIARETGCHQRTVCHVLSGVWKFPPGHGHRYMMVGLNEAQFTTLGWLAAKLGVDRNRALEKIVHTVLKDTATLQTLRDRVTSSGWLAADALVNRKRTMELLVKVALEDDANVARRILRV
jgi:hypothetical protein